MSEIVAETGHIAPAQLEMSVLGHYAIEIVAPAGDGPSNCRDSASGIVESYRDSRVGLRCWFLGPSCLRFLGLSVVLSRAWGVRERVLPAVSVGIWAPSVGCGRFRLYLGRSRGRLISTGLSSARV